MNLYWAEQEARDIARLALDKLLKDSAVVLEVGCGGGEFLRQLCCGRQARCIGVDPYASSAARECGIDIRRMPAEEIGCLPERFDIVFTIISLHHFRSKDAFIAQAASVLKKKGLLVIIDWRKGVDTGINERYFSLSEISASAQPYFLPRREKNYRFHFLFVGEKR